MPYRPWSPSFFEVHAQMCERNALIPRRAKEGKATPTLGSWRNLAGYPAFLNFRL
jgi:hypothetical protein